MSSSSPPDMSSLKREESDDSPTASSPASLHSTLSSQSSPPASSNHGNASSFHHSHSHSNQGLGSPSLSSVSSTELSPSPSASHPRGLDPSTNHTSHQPTPPPRAHPPPLHSSPHPTSSSSASSPDDGDTGISGFIRKTYNMVSDPSTSDIVAWDDAGDAFIVKKEFDFASLVLPKYFRHKNFSSFVRQLNFYGFHKRSHQSRFTKFQHPHFKRGQLSALHLIKRKSAEANANFKDNIAQLTAQVTDLKRQYDDLYRIQQQILYIFARYMKAYPLPAQMDAPLLAGASPTVEERGGKRQRLIGDGSSSSMPFSSIPTANGGALASNGPPHVSASTLAALLSSPSPISSGSLNAPQLPSHLSARDQELAELTALQSVLSQIPAGQALLNSHMAEPFTAQTAAAMSSSFIPARSSHYGPSPPPPSLPPPVLAATAPAAMDLTGISGLSAAGGSLGQLNPIILSALGALSGTGSSSYHSTAASNGQHQRLDNGGGMASGSQLSGLSSLSALPPLSSLSSSSPPLSAQDLLQLLQHAHPNNRASRISAIRQEQRMLEDDDDDLDEEDDFDDHHGDGAFINGTAADWMTSSAASTLPFTSSAAADSGRYVTLTSPPQFHAQPLLDKSLSAMYALPLASSADVLMDSYAGSQLALQDSSASSFASNKQLPLPLPLSALSLKTQEVGPLYSNSVDPFHFSLHNQLAAGSASQNASSSVSMSTSTVSGTTPLHLKPTSSIPLDSAALHSLTPALQATLQSTLAQLRVNGSSSQSQTVSAPSHGGGGLAGYSAQHSADGEVQSRLVSQLQAIANVSKQLQSLHHPSLTSSAYPSTFSSPPPFTHPQLSGTQAAASYHTLLQHSAALPSHYEEFSKSHAQQLLPAYAASHAAFAHSHSALAATSAYAQPASTHAQLSSLYAREAHTADGYYGGSHSNGPFAMAGHSSVGHTASALHAQSHGRGHVDALTGAVLRNPII